MIIKPFLASDDAAPVGDRLTGLRLPVIHPTADAVLDADLCKRLEIQVGHLIKTDAIDA